jgi:hypothetical protein
MTWVTDDVWQHLHPGAGRLSRRGAARTWIAVGLSLALVTAVAAVLQSGLVVPQLGWDFWGVKPTRPVSDTVGIDVGITNFGLAPVTLAGIGRDGPGLHLTRVEGRLPVRVAPTASARLTLYYRITDCAETPVGSWPVAVRIAQPWGTRTATPRMTGSESFPWRRLVTDPWCRSRR